MADDSDVLKQIAEAVRRLEGMMAYLPDGVAKELRHKLATLRGIMLEQRPPAFALVGRRGAGKSSLVNALFGARVAEVGHVKSQTGRGRWYDFRTSAGALTILDTRGFQEGSTPDETPDAASALAAIALEIKRKAPDVVLFVIKATEADAAIDADLDALEQVLEEVRHQHGYEPPLVVIATHCDLLEPKNVKLHAPGEEDLHEVEEKLVRVAQVERLLDAKFRGRPNLAPQFIRSLGISTYFSFRSDGAVRADERWRMDDLSSLFFRHLPDAGRGVFVRIARVRALQDELALQLTRAAAALCAGIAAVPIPVADLIPITGTQASLIGGIAWIGGRELGRKAAGEFFTGLGVNVGAAFALREAARALAKFVFPGAGSAVSATVAFAGTMAVGAAARAYFIHGLPLDRAKDAYREARQHAEREGSRDPERRTLRTAARPQPWRALLQATEP